MDVDEFSEISNTLRFKRGISRVCSSLTHLLTYPNLTKNELIIIIGLMGRGGLILGVRPIGDERHLFGNLYFCFLGTSH